MDAAPTEQPHPLVSLGEAVLELSACSDLASFQAASAAWTERLPDCAPLISLIPRLRERFELQQREEKARADARYRQVELETLMETLPVPVWIAHDSAASIITGSRAADEILRIPKGANASKSDPDAPVNHFCVMKDGRVLGPDELPIQMAARTGQSVIDFEEQLVFDDGTVRHLVGGATPIRNDLGEVRGAVAAFFDITRRVEAEMKLRSSEANYRFLAEAVPVLVWQADREGKITFVNSRWQAYFGDDFDLETRTAGTVAIVHPEDLPVAQETWGRAKETGSDFSLEYRLRRRDGQFRWHLCIGRAQWEEGQLRGWVGSITDVEEQKVKEGMLAFLVRLDESLRHLTEPREVLAISTGMLRDYLGVERCAFAEADQDTDVFVVTGESTEDRPMLGVPYTFLEFGEDLQVSVRDNKSYVCADAYARKDYHAGKDLVMEPVRIRSAVCTPLHRGGKLVAVMFASSHHRREWAEEEVRLMELVIERSWTYSERTRVEQDRFHATRRYQALAEVAASVVFAANTQGHLTEIPFIRNLPQGIETNGLGDGWFAIVHPSDRKGLMRAWDESIRTHLIFEHEFRMLSTSGTYRWHLGRALLLPASASRPAEWIGACVDVHDRFSTDRLLRIVNQFTAATRSMTEPGEVIQLAQRLLGTALVANRVGYGESTEEGRRNPAAPNYCDGCEDISARQITPPNSSIVRAIGAGKTVILHDVARQVREDETRRVLLQNRIGATISYPITQAGSVVGVLYVQQTEPRTWSLDEVELVRVMAERMWSELNRVRASQAVEHSEQRLRRTLQAATVGVLIRVPGGRFVYANRPILEMLGHEEADLMSGSVSWANILDPSWKELERNANRELAEQGTCRPYECEFIARDGTRIPVYLGAATVPDIDGDQRLHAIFVTDLTPIKDAERELVRLNESLERRVHERTAELEAANREMEGFTYAVAHDLRSPLRAIIATASILLAEAGEELSDEHRHLLHRQSANAQHLARLLDDLLIYARIARQEVKRATVDISALAKTVADEINRERPNEIRIQPGMTAVVDPSLIRLALQNLIENACKFSPNGTPVEFGIERTSRGLAYFVRDSGVGFDMRHVSKLFEPFVRLVHQSEFPGTGIGLANVKRVVERHGGEVWVDAAPQKGATFWFTLA